MTTIELINKLSSKDTFSSGKQVRSVEIINDDIEVEYWKSITDIAHELYDIEIRHQKRSTYKHEIFSLYKYYNDYIAKLKFLLKCIDPYIDENNKNYITNKLKRKIINGYCKLNKYNQLWRKSL